MERIARVSSPLVEALSLLVRDLSPSAPPLVLGVSGEEDLAQRIGESLFVSIGFRARESRREPFFLTEQARLSLPSGQRFPLVILTAAASAATGLERSFLETVLPLLTPDGRLIAAIGGETPTPPAGEPSYLTCRARLLEERLRVFFPHTRLIGAHRVAGVLLDGASPPLFCERDTDSGGRFASPPSFMFALASSLPLPEHAGALLLTPPSDAPKEEEGPERRRRETLITLLAERVSALEAENALLRQNLALAKGEAQRAAAELFPLIGLADDGRRLEKAMRAFGEALVTARRAIKTNPAEKARIRNIVAESAFFDRAWYLASYQDVRERGIDPLDHYIEEGALLGYDPGPDFSSYGYYLLHPDVLASATNPLFHYEITGRRENRRLRPSLRREERAGRERGNHLILPEREQKGGHKPRIVIISGEADTPGHVYRVVRFAEAARALGAMVSIHDYSELDLDSLAPLVAASDLLFIWRAPLSPEIRTPLEAARERGVIVVFDVDDLMVDPRLADPKIIDGIRTRKLDRSHVAGHFAATQETLKAADFAIAPTHYLAGELQRWAVPTFVLPNGFDEEAWRIARLARRRRELTGGDGLVRIGYAAGSRTHQRDFARAVPALAEVLLRHPEARLVLFRKGPWPTVDLDEFPELAGLENQIEWRDMVPVEALPGELARFDVNIAPLETGNPFCEAKSELKYFESALVEVPSVCSPTDPFRRAIRQGETGFLAANEEEWRDILSRLVEDAALRQRIGRNAYLHVLWAYGPERRVELVASLLEQTLARGRRAARAFALDVALAASSWTPPPLPPETRVVLRHDTLRPSRVSVIIPLYNYADYILETLESVAAQTLADLDLVVVDDHSTDPSLARVGEWLERNQKRFNRALLLTNTVNAGLARSRNAGFLHAETPFVMPFDADNVMLPECLAQCLEALETSGAAFVYPTLERFGAEEGIFANLPYDPLRLAPGNYIDATALIRRAVWAAVGGYHDIRPQGWEDYEFWCRLAEKGLFGHHLDATLVRYRVHPRSMLRTESEINRNRLILVQEMRKRHPWTLEGRERTPKEGWEDATKADAR